MCLPFLSSSTMFGLPAAATNVGNQSSPETIPFSTLPAGTLPGPRTIAGTRAAAFAPRARAAGERSLSAIRPSEVLGAVVGGEHHDGVVVETVGLQIGHDRADDVVELRHAGFLDAPAVVRVAHRLVF